MEVLLPANLSEALSMKADRPDAVPMAGGTDLLVEWPVHLERHEDTYVDLWGLDELRPIRWTDEAVELGALTTYWDTIQDSRIRKEFPLLPEAARQVGAIQIQSRGTYAGNIANASPAADGVPVLMAYDAIVVLASADGEREVELADFYHGYKQLESRPDELIRAIRMPRRCHDVEVFHKVGSRRAQAITKVGVALAHSEEAGWRVVANSVAPTVCRCPAVERLLGETVVVDNDGIADASALSGPEDPDLLEAARQDVSPIDDVRSTARYRERVLCRILFFALHDLRDGTSGARSA